MKEVNSLKTIQTPFAIISNKFSFNMVKGKEEKEVFEEGISSQTEANVILEIDGKVEEITANHDRGTISALRKAVLEGGKKHYLNLGKLIVADFKIHVLDYTETGILIKSGSS
ncbi:unnamed protein product [marine sediment metagenome]|uniref:Uncharacterized protein n=1 Tax=marine sediment metagenome TaxID=412755 RepID=X0U8M7_9ZZZZ